MKEINTVETSSPEFSLFNTNQHPNREIEVNANWQQSALQVKSFFLEEQLIQQFNNNADQMIETCRRISKNNYSCHSVAKVESSVNYRQHDELIDHQTTPTAPRVSPNKI